MPRPNALPILDRISVAAPCDESWEDMTGDARVRHCASCDRDVFDLSGMTRDEATALLAARGESICARFYRRHDGTVLTADCPVGLARIRRRLLLIAAGVASFLGLSVVLAGTTGRVMLGHDPGSDVLGGSPTVQAMTALFRGNPPLPPKRLMGKIAIPHFTNPTPVPPPANGGTP